MGWALRQAFAHKKTHNIARKEIITDMNTALQNPDIYDELQDIAKQLINEGMEMSL